MVPFIISQVLDVRASAAQRPMPMPAQPMSSGHPCLPPAVARGCRPLLPAACRRCCRPPRPRGRRTVPLGRAFPLPCPVAGRPAPRLPPPCPRGPARLPPGRSRPLPTPRARCALPARAHPAHARTRCAPRCACTPRTPPDATRPAPTPVPRTHGLLPPPRPLLGGREDPRAGIIMSVSLSISIAYLSVSHHHQNNAFYKHECCSPCAVSKCFLIYNIVKVTKQRWLPKSSHFTAGGRGKREVNNRPASAGSEWRKK